MHRDATALRDLLTRLEAAEGPVVLTVEETDACARAMFGGFNLAQWGLLHRALTENSLDACALLQEGRLPGYVKTVIPRANMPLIDVYVANDDSAPHGAHALETHAHLIAIVRACIAEAEHETR